MKGITKMNREYRVNKIYCIREAIVSLLEDKNQKESNEEFIKNNRILPLNVAIDGSSQDLIVLVDDVMQDEREYGNHYGDLHLINNRTYNIRFDCHLSFIEEYLIGENCYDLTSYKNLLSALMDYHVKGNQVSALKYENDDRKNIGYHIRQNKKLWILPTEHIYPNEIVECHQNYRLQFGHYVWKKAEYSFVNEHNQGFKYPKDYPMEEEDKDETRGRFGNKTYLSINDVQYDRINRCYLKTNEKIQDVYLDYFLKRKFELLLILPIGRTEFAPVNNLSIVDCFYMEERYKNYIALVKRIEDGMIMTLPLMILY